MAPSERSPLAYRFHRSLPGYAATPLIDAPALATELGVARVWVKDESCRLGLPSFKVLGASWAAYRALCQLVAVDPREEIGLRELRLRLRPHRPLQLLAATDGNHGRAVARVARLLELDAQIFVPDEMVAERRAAITAEGAALTVVEGGYDDAVARSAAQADERALVISDTSWPGYEQIPASVIDGYATIGLELDQQLAELGSEPPDLVVVQIGVGALAAAVVRHFRPQGATIVGVEPTDAACVAASIEAGAMTATPGPHCSIMAGLNCGLPSLVAWPTLKRGLDMAATVHDAHAEDAIRLLAKAGIVSGESGAAGLAGLLAHRTELQLTPSSAVLLISTEGATDQDAYTRIVAGRRSGC